MCLCDATDDCYVVQSFIEITSYLLTDLYTENMGSNITCKSKQINIITVICIITSERVICYIT